jgi:hypothetical protein
MGLLRELEGNQMKQFSENIEVKLFYRSKEQRVERD